MRTVVFLVFLASFMGAVCADPFDPTRTRLVQDWNTNRLIRGNLPIWKDGQLALPWLYKRYGTNQTKAIIVVSLLDPKNREEDRIDIQHEHQLIQEEPSPLYAVEFYNKPVYPEDVSPRQFVDNARERRVLGKYVKDWSRGFRLMRETVAFVRDLMEKRAHTVLFVHCEQGTDRTGVVMGSYLFHYTGAQWYPIQRANFHIQNRQLLPQYQTLLDWEAVCQEIHHTVKEERNIE